jgi:vacuolar-type H+-ATPase subunit H
MRALAPPGPAPQKPPVSGAFLACPVPAAHYHHRVAEKPATKTLHSRAPRASSAADRVEGIIGAAEQAAERIRLETEERVRERIAEGERAAQNRIDAAEEEAAEIVRWAQEEAARVREAAKKESDAVRTKAESEALTTVVKAQETADQAIAEAQSAATTLRDESDKRARELLRDARETANGVRAEGLDIVSDLSEMGNSLRSNAERLLRDVQTVHSGMVERIDRAQVGLGRAPRSNDGDSDEPRPRRRDLPALDADGEVIDVPEFMP